MCVKTGSIKPFSLSLEVRVVSMKGNKKQKNLGPQEVALLVRKEIFGEEFKDVEMSVEHRP